MRPTNVSSTYEGTLRGAQLGLLESALRDDASGLWLSSAGAENLGGSGAFQVYNAHKGVAGVVYLLARMARCGFGTDAARDRVRHAVRWLIADDAQTEALPGLHFGEAGVAVAIAEAMAAGLVERDTRLTVRAQGSFRSAGLARHHARCGRARRCGDVLRR